MTPLSDDALVEALAAVIGRAGGPPSLHRDAAHALLADPTFGPALRAVELPPDPCVELAARMWALVWDTLPRESFDAAIGGEGEALDGDSYAVKCLAFVRSEVAAGRWVPGEGS